MFVLAGCNRFLQLDQVPIPPDAPVYLVCHQQMPAPIFCADFDDASGGVYGDGLALTVPAAPNADVTVGVHPQGVSPDNALWVDTTNDPPSDTYKLIYTSPKMVARPLHAEVDVDVDAYNGMNTTEIFEIGIDTGTVMCGVQLQLHHTDMTVRRHDCMQTSQPMLPLFGGIPSSWSHYKLDFDLAAGSASVAFEDNAPVPVDLGYSAAGGGNPYIVMGVLYVGGGAGPRLGFDNANLTAP
jgi:hypothetical protein